MQCLAISGIIYITAIAKPELQQFLSPNGPILCRNDTVLHGKIGAIIHIIRMQTMHGKLAESQWTDTAHLFMVCFTNFTDIEYPLDENDTGVQVEAEKINCTRWEKFGSK